MSDMCYDYHVRHRGRSEMSKSVGTKIYENNMESRITIRLDGKHLDIIEEVQKEKGLSNKSEAIRYIIEQYSKIK